MAGTYVVEQYWPGVTEAQFRAAAARIRSSTAGLDGVRLLHLTFVPGDEAAFGVVAAPSSRVVAEAYRRAGVAYERILDAVEVGA
jgi:hypothetical protein